MKPLSVAVPALCGAIVAGGAVYWRAHTVISALHDDRMALRQQLAERDRQAQAAAAEIAALKQQAAPAQDAAAELAKTRQALAATQAEYLSTKAALARTQVALAPAGAVPTATPMDPAEEAALRAQMARRYAGLIQKLGLSAADADRFVGLMVSRRHAADDVVASAEAEGGGAAPSVSDVAGLVSATRGQIESDLRSLLGDSGYQQLQGYEAASGASGTVTRLQTRLAATAPLTDDQTQQLQQLLNAAGVGHLTPPVIAKAQGFLSAEQFQALQTLYAQQRAAQLQRRTGVTPGASQ